MIAYPVDRYGMSEIRDGVRLRVGYIDAEHKQVHFDRYSGRLTASDLRELADKLDALSTAPPASPAKEGGGANG